jgi:hypothetical protein
MKTVFRIKEITSEGRVTAPVATNWKEGTAGELLFGFFSETDFDTREAAVAAITEFHSKHPDSWHEFVIMEFFVNEQYIG